MAAEQFAYLVARELSVPAIALTATHLSGIIASFRQSNYDIVQDIANQLTTIMPTIKLQIVPSLSSDFVNLRTQSKTIDTLLDNIAAEALLIKREYSIIQSKVQSYENAWFKSWITLDVKEHFKKIQSHVVQLDKSFELLIGLLPNFVKLERNRNKSFNHNKNNNNNNNKINDKQLICSSSDWGKKTTNILDSIDDQPYPQLEQNMQVEKFDFGYENQKNNKMVKPSAPPMISISP